LATCGAIGSLIGPVITGTALDRGLIPLAFVVYAPIMILALPFILAWYPNKKVVSSSKSFDFAGIILLIVALVCIILWLTQGGSLFPWIGPVSFGMIAVGIIAFIVLVQVEKSHPNPSVALYLFKKKRFRYAFVTNFFLAAFSVILSGFAVVYIQQVMKVSATISGTATMPMTIARAVCGASLGAFVGQKFSKRFRPVTLLSLVLSLGGVLIICMLKPESSMILVYAASVLGGIGSVIPQSAFAPFFQAELQQQEYGAAQGLYSMGSSGGASVFSAFAGMMLNKGFSLPNIFIMGAAFCFLALFFAFIGLRIPKETPAAT
jgi:MFS family permease